MRRLFALLVLVVPAQSFAQTATDSTVAVRLTDGSVVYGRLVLRSADSVVVTTISGRTAFARSNVRHVRPAGTPHIRRDGKTEYWFPNANTTRLLFAPTGRTLDRRSGYFANHDGLLGSLSYGVSDRVTVGGGTVLLPGLSTWFVTPKVGLVRSERLNVAAGALYGGIAGATGGVAFLSGTAGGTDNNVTLAVGEGFSGSRFAHSQVVMLGGERRVARRLSLITENYLFPHVNQPLVAYGARILGEKISVDLAFLNTAGEGMVFPGFPYVDFVIRF